MLVNFTLEDVDERIRNPVNSVIVNSDENVVSDRGSISLADQQEPKPAQNNEVNPVEIMTISGVSQSMQSERQNTEAISRNSSSSLHGNWQ